jgi:hypothetical protein
MQDYSRLGVTTMKDRRKLFQASLFFSGFLSYIIIDILTMLDI